MPFTPDMIFMAKSRVDYNPNAVNVVIHNDDDGTDWDVESWMMELSDDPAVVNVLWQVLGAVIRPNVPWGKAAWFYSETGNNGKGTLCELMRQLCGSGSYTSIPLSEMGKDFMLEPLIQSSAVIVDENDVGTYIDKAANLKAIITNDVVQINRKFKTAVPYKFYGFMVQCLNEMPRIKDKSNSFFRRQLFIPFDKCFTGKERKYIKHDYLHRQDVLEYVLFKVLNMDNYELSVPESCKKALEEYSPCTEKPYTEVPYTGAPCTEEPCTENPAQINKDITSKEEFKKHSDGYNNVNDVLPIYKKYDNRYTIVNRIKAGVCEICGSTAEYVCMHHVRILKSLTGANKFERKMLEIRRKSLALCPDCWNELQMTLTTG